MAHSKRVFVCGDVNGNLDKLYTDLQEQEKVHGKFDFLIACGKFLPTDQDDSGFHAYFNGTKEVPIMTYFIDSESAVFTQTAPKGKLIGKTKKLHFLGAFGVKTIEGLRIGYISGKMGDAFDTVQNHDDGTPAHVNGQYTRSIIDSMKRMAKDGPLDLLISSEWPRGIEVNTKDAPVDAKYSSTAISELCQAFEPRFHVFGLAGRFYRRQPYVANQGTYICRHVGLGSVGSKGKDKKWLHALIMVSLKACTPDKLLRGKEEAGICPFPQRKRASSTILPAAKLRKIPVPPQRCKIVQDGRKWILHIYLGPDRSFSIEAGEIFQHAHGVVVRDGQTQVWGTTSSESKIGGLSVSYEDHASDVPTSEIRKVLEDTMHGLLDSWHMETRITAYHMCNDGNHPPASLAICAASASVTISDIPYQEPVAAVAIAMTENFEYIVNPTVDECTASKMHMLLAGTLEVVSTIEMSGNFVTEEQFLKGVTLGHDAIKVICRGLMMLRSKGQPKKTPTSTLSASYVETTHGNLVSKLLQNARLSAEEKRLGILKIESELAQSLYAPARMIVEKDVDNAVNKLVSHQMLDMIQKTGKRIDGRVVTACRPVEVRNPNAIVDVTMGIIHSATHDAVILSDIGDLESTFCTAFNISGNELGISSARLGGCNILTCAFLARLLEQAKVCRLDILSNLNPKIPEMGLKPNSKSKERITVPRTFFDANRTIDEFKFVEICFRDNICEISGTDTQVQAIRAKFEATMSGPLAYDYVSVPKSSMETVLAAKDHLQKTYGLSDMLVFDVGNQTARVEIYGGSDVARGTCLRRIKTIAESKGFESQSEGAMDILPGMEWHPPQAAYDELKKKLQLEFAHMWPGHSKMYRFLPHELRLATNIAAALKMTIKPSGNGEFIITRRNETT